MFHTSVTSRQMSWASYWKSQKDEMSQKSAVAPKSSGLAKSSTENQPHYRKAEWVTLARRGLWNGWEVFGGRVKSAGRGQGLNQKNLIKIIMFFRSLLTNASGFPQAAFTHTTHISLALF